MLDQERAEHFKRLLKETESRNKEKGLDRSLWEGNGPDYRTLLSGIRYGWDPELARLAARFFSGKTDILSTSSGDAERDALVAMSAIVDFIQENTDDALNICRPSGHGPSQTRVEAGEIEYCYYSQDGTCYDGGCYSDETTNFYLVITLVSDEQMTNIISDLKQHPQIDLHYWSILKSSVRTDPVDGSVDPSAFFYKRDYYLVHPFNMKDSLCISRDCN